jgi:hypothetical protein
MPCTGGQAAQLGDVVVLPFAGAGRKGSTTSAAHGKCKLSDNSYFSIFVLFFGFVYRSPEKATFYPAPGARLWSG